MRTIRASAPSPRQSVRPVDSRQPGMLDGLHTARIPQPGCTVMVAPTSGDGANPTGTLGFLSPTVDVHVNAHQRIAATASKTFGSVLAAGGSQLSLNLCLQRLPSGPIVRAIANDMDGIRVSGGTSVPMTLSHVAAVIDAGNYRVGLCGFSGSAQSWNQNFRGFVTAMVIDVPPS